MNGVSLTATVSTVPARDTILITVRGFLDLQTVPLVRRTLMKCLIEAPDAVIVEVGEMSVDHRSRLAVFPAAAQTHAPTGTALMICGASAALATQMGGRVLGDVESFPTYTDALAAVGSGGARAPRRASIRLGAVANAPQRARAMVAHACRTWNIDRLVGPATLVISELVSNAVEHARTDLHATCILRGDYLLVSVRDYCPQLPVIAPAELRDGAPHAVRGRGLRLVEAYSAAWDIHAGPDTKTVWAALRATPATPWARPAGPRAVTHGGS
jgi:anti-sigma regulatory factor (Ser/Thr protein kinase)/anti-anti-sigma regulatory factor